MERAQSIATADLELRESRQEDLEQFYRWERDPEVSRYFSIPDGQTRAAVETEFYKALADPQSRQYTICVRDGGRPIGRVVLAGRLEGWKVEIFRIYLGDLDSRGKGYGRQTMEGLLKLCFEDWGMERVYLDHYTDNPAARLYLSLGFQYEGVLRKNCQKNGVLHDVHLMSMLRADYAVRHD